MRDTIRREIEEVFRNVFGDQELVLQESMTAADVDGWDSLAHINLIIALEKRLGVRFATAEISRLKEDGQTVGSLLDLVEQKKRA
ncbi:MAG TPA: acyl carrier protein [Verrucomicrobiota bacterium]|jgi:acyl carrier protein|nr:acyl carrier protein [Verrucomicrobiota bacterium]HQL78605.1 acyl carrier protein [Verrucomicrobiota bacterium]